MRDPTSSRVVERCREGGPLITRSNLPMVNGGHPWDGDVGVHVAKDMKADGRHVDG